MKNFVLHALVILEMCVAGVTCNATILFSDYEASAGFGNVGFYVPQWYVAQGGPAGTAVAASFSIPGGSWALSKVALVLSHIQDSDNLAVSVYADIQGEPAPNPLETIGLNPIGLGSVPQEVVLSSSLTPVLNSGSSYWLVVAPQTTSNTVDATSNAVYGWYENNTIVIGNMKTKRYDFDNGNWLGWRSFDSTVLAAFRIEGTLVPEPASLWLLLGGAGLLGWHRLRHTR